MGRPRPQPILRLKDRATGRQFYVVNTHPSAHGGRYLAERRRGERKLVAVVKRLRRTGLPVLVTGDMNDREKFYCRVAPPARLVAANGGSYAHGCRPPQSPVPVDWVLGSRGTGWTHYWRDTRPVERRISDHFLVSGIAHVGRG
jgi:endonuclease/exonuclease/phosphatase family metal-dependent hydrolase